MGDGTGALWEAEDPDPVDLEDLAVPARGEELDPLGSQLGELGPEQRTHPGWTEVSFGAPGRRLLSGLGWRVRGHPGTG